MMQILGNPGGGDEIVSNISGKAVEMIQQRLDMQTFIYMSNFSKGMRRCGEIWLSMAKDVYVEEGRKMKIIDVTDEVDSVTMMQPGIGESGEIKIDNDLSEANFDVDVDVGPSSSSKRQATVRALTGMMQITQDPETMQVLGSMAMMNIEGEGVDDVKSFFRNRLIKMGVVTPTETEAEDLMAASQNAPEDPNAVFLKAAAEEAQAKAQGARASVIKTLADAELAQAKVLETAASTKLDGAKTMETLSGIKSEDQQRMINAAKQVREMSNSIGGPPRMPSQPIEQQLQQQPPQQVPQMESDMANMTTEELINIARGQ